MKKILIRIFPILFLLGVILILVYAANTRPRVFIVMSYSANDPWEEQIRHGIEKAFATKAPFIRLEYFYLDTQNTPEDYIVSNVNSALALIKSYQPQLMILVDDNAQARIGMRFLNNPKVSLVFAGVNANPAIYGYQSTLNVTGIIENLHYTAMQDAMLTIFPSYKKIIHLSDHSNTSNFVHQQIISNNWSPLQMISSNEVNTVDEWLNIVKQANDQRALLLLSHFQSITDHGKLFDAKKLIAKTLSVAKVPILDFFDFTVEEGVPMALSTSGFEQGAVAVKLALLILVDHKNAGDIPFEYSQYFDFAINQESIQLNMPSVKIPNLYQSLAYLTAEREI